MTIQELDDRINSLREKTYVPIPDEDLLAMQNMVTQKELDLRALQVDLTLERERIINDSISLTK